MPVSQRVLPESLSDMSATKTFATGADWTQLLADPDLVSHLGKLLKVCREAAPEKRGKALFDAIREIKQGASAKHKEDDGGGVAVAEPAPAPQEIASESAPPFEPDMFTPSSWSDRRQVSSDAVLSWQ